MKDEEDLDQQDDKDKYNAWLTEDFLLDDVDRTKDQQERLEKLYDYLMLLGGYDEELEEE